MLIILEGVDGSGKTTLAKTIKRLVPGMVIRHNGVPQQHPLIEYSSECDEAERLLDQGHHVLFDRLHWGELAYGPVYRGGSLLGRSGFVYVEKRLQRLGGIVVYCDAPDDVIEKRLTQTDHELSSDERDRNYLKLKDIGAIKRAYGHVGNMACLPALKYDSSTQDVVSVARAIIGGAQFHEPTGRMPMGYIGPIKPRDVVVVHSNLQPWESNDKVKDHYIKLSRSSLQQRRLTGYASTGSVIRELPHQPLNVI